MLSPVSTNFLARLKANDEAAWFELWETFGPVLRAQLAKWGKGRVGVETVKDLSQETLAAASNSIERFDASRGVRFSTWLLAIAKHVMGDEMDRRGALKRNASQKPQALDESWMVSDGEMPVDRQYEQSIFRAKVEAAVRAVSTSADFTDFAVYRMRVLEGKPGKEVAEAMGMSEPTVSRRCAKVRDQLRLSLAEIVARYSFTTEESAEPTRNGLDLFPKKDTTPAEDAMFDDAIAEISHAQALARRGESRTTD